MIPYILLQIVLLPILAAPFVYLLGRRIGAKVGWVSFIVLLYTLLLTLLVGISPGISESYPWPPIGYFGLSADGLSIPFFFTIIVLSMVIAIYSIPYMEHRIGQNKGELGLYFALYLLYAAGMVGTVLATNLIQFYLFFELMLIPSYFLIAEWGYGEREKISFMYFMWTHVGAVSLLIGILSVGYLAGSFDLAAIAGSAIPEGLRIWLVVAMCLGLFVKMAIFGLHVWLPHAHAEAPTPISALLSPAMIGIGGYAVVRLVLTILPSTFKEITLLLGIWALITMVYGGAMAIAQDDIKRLLAYSSISQMGYLLFGITSYYYLGITGSMFHYVSHGTCKGILFMTAGAIILQAHGLRSISKMGGLARRMPITAICALIGFLGILGAPPLNGFQSEWMIFAGAFSGAIYSGMSEKMLVAVLAMFSTVLTAGYALWTVRRIFFGPLPKELEKVKEAPFTVTMPMLVLAFLTVLLGIYPEFVAGYLIPISKQILGV